MKLSKIITKNSCKICKDSIAFKLDGSFSKNILPLLLNAGFKENPNFTKAGLLYVENDGIIATGKFGSNIIQTKCKRSNCEIFINNLEAILLTLE